MKTTIVVGRYTQPDEFLRDLEADKDDVERGIVRLTTVRRPSGPNGALTRISVEAGAIIEGRPVLLEHTVGELWDHHTNDSEVKVRTTEVVEAIAAGVADLGLQLRAGVFELREVVAA
jgi:hypothetical protein